MLTLVFRMIPLAAPTTGAHPQCDSTEAGSKMAEYILQRAWKFTMEAPGTWEQEEKPLIPPLEGVGRV